VRVSTRQLSSNQLTAASLEGPKNRNSLRWRVTPPISSAAPRYDNRVNPEQEKKMNIKNFLGRAAGIAATAVVIGGLSLTGVASASTVQPAAAAKTLSPQAGPVSPAINGPITCAIQTNDGHYLTAVGGGGRTTDVLHTDATRIGAWEKFTLIDSGDGSSNIHYGFKTVHGYYLTVVGGGGRTTDVIHSDATNLLAWEKLTAISLGYGVYAIQTINGHYLTATGGGGRTTDTIHSDATRIGSWEKFRFTCGI
jgi:hypothetical protein